MSASRELVELDLGVGPLDRLRAVTESEWTMEAVCAAVGEGRSLREIAKGWGVPVGKFTNWVLSDPGREAEYEAALRVHADDRAREVIPIADLADEETARSALRVKARQWLAGKMDPARYGEHAKPRVVARVLVDRTCAEGDKVAVEVTGE